MSLNTLLLTLTPELTISGYASWGERRAEAKQHPESSKGLKMHLAYLGWHSGVADACDCLSDLSKLLTSKELG